MLILTGLIVQVSAKESKDYKTGEISKVHIVTIQHSVNLNPDSDIELEKIKVKHSGQAEAFAKLKGQTVSFPVQVWTTEKGAQGFWIAEGVLPTPQRAAAA